MKKKNERSKAKDRGVVFLADLAPRKDVKGGAGKIIFGQGANPFSEVEEEKRDKKK